MNSPAWPVREVVIASQTVKPVGAGKGGKKGWGGSEGVGPLVRASYHDYVVAAATTASFASGWRSRRLRSNHLRVH